MIQAPAADNPALTFAVARTPAPAYRVADHDPRGYLTGLQRHRMEKKPAEWRVLELPASLAVEEPAPDAAVGLMRR